MFNGLSDVRYNSFFSLVACGPRNWSAIVNRIFASAACVGKVFTYRRRKRQVFFLNEVILRCRSFAFNGDFADFFCQGEAFYFRPGAFEIDAGYQGACANDACFRIEIRSFTYFIVRFRFLFHVSIFYRCVGLEGRIRNRLVHGLFGDSEFVNWGLAVLFMRFIRDHYANATHYLMDECVRDFCVEGLFSNFRYSGRLGNYTVQINGRAA